MPIKQLISSALICVERFVDKSPQPAEIRDIVLRNFRRLSAAPQQLSDSDRDDLISTQQILAHLGWIDASAPLPAPPMQGAPTLESARLWRAGLSAKGVLEGKRFAPGSGRFLDRLDQSGTDEEQQFARQQSERLMRHVEVQRQQCLAESLPPSPPAALFLEKCDVAILFSRFAVRRHDLRFLNTALKMNDWLLTLHRTEKLPARLVLSLAEQESAAARLL